MPHLIIAVVVIIIIIVVVLHNITARVIRYTRRRRRRRRRAANTAYRPKRIRIRACKACIRWGFVYTRVRVNRCEMALRCTGVTYKRRTLVAKNDKELRGRLERGYWFVATVFWSWMYAEKA